MFKVDIEGLDGVVGRLNTLTPKLKKQIYRKAARQLIKSAKARIDRQTDLDGQPFKPRADGSKEPLLKGKRGGRPGIRKLLTVLEATDSEATVGWQNPFFGNLAGKHQFGFSEPTR